ncbi:hypothetical protein AQZ52_03460 [Novosphingobium fuchskuhlense]|uniref:Acyltransferase 3 domain-containing protein n=1 Tax=Novosphingobium fuchskuhlense TaxID=1117702 RepID=A0A117UWV5_9SPHN|nr:hypothetical protein AQZ52_03460 [Novosphingobium fuchskuhlense]
MWSLAVEEQFYLLYPVVLLAILRFRPRALPLLFGLGFGLSLVLAGVLMRFRPDIAFYYLPPRAWELMLGGAISLRERRAGSLRAGRYTGPVSGLALAGLLVAFLLPGDSGSFPWPGALLPCLCTATLLAVLRSEYRTAGLLAARPIVLVGLISYSLYLWHQPVFAFARKIALNALTPANYVVMIGGVFLAAWATWRFIEQPLRRSDGLSNGTVPGSCNTGGLACRQRDRGMAGQRLALALLAANARTHDDGARFPSPQQRCQSDDQANPRCSVVAHWP